MNGLGSIQDPDLRALLQAHKDEVFFGLNCHQVGQIEAFDAASQTARIKLMMQRVVFNKEQGLNAALQLTPTVVDYPVLVDCPVFVVSGGGAVFTVPVAAGDSCLVLFNDRDIDNWFATGAPAQPNTSRAHSLSDGFALIGFRSKRNPIANYSTTDAELKNAGGRISIAAKIAIANEATDLKTVLDAFITAMQSLDSLKTGPSAAAAITAAQTASHSLLKS